MLVIEIHVEVKRCITVHQDYSIVVLDYRLRLQYIKQMTDVVRYGIYTIMQRKAQERPIWKAAANQSTERSIVSEERDNYDL